jgi:cation diffusion facilitator CzcD-associated flavoprotein CzcO
MIVNNSRQMAGEKFMANPDHSSQDNRAVVIGAGLGGLAAAMRLGAKGYAVTGIGQA